MNAIILAAGMGTRLRPLTNDRPKCLVAVNGVPMVERQIQFLKEKGIYDITLISGYKAEALNYLKDKYGVDIVFNDRFETCNNINSLYIVRDRFHDTYVLEGDVYMDKNVLLSEVSKSTYFARKKKYENEWGLEVDGNNKLTHINIGDGDGFLMSGISYWKAEDCKKIVAHMEDVYATKDYTDLYWDNMVLDIYPDLDIRVKDIEGIYEIDTPVELKEVEEKLKVYKMDKKYIHVEELKSIQLDMLSDIAEFCEQNQIKYFLAYGTLIGAIRHKGYIPWDDDIDICMPRPDYNKFLKLYNQKASAYKVVDFELDNHYKLPFAKVNDTRTIMWETMYEQDVFGVYIDVFPIDGCDKEGKIIFKNNKLGQFLNAKKAILGKGRTFKKNCIIAMGKCLLAFISVKSLLLKMQENAEIVPYDHADYVANIMYSYGTCEIMTKSELEETILSDFEGYKFRIPKEYDKYLTQIYGDYMQLPPEDKRVSTHTFKAWWK